MTTLGLHHRLIAGLLGLIIYCLVMVLAAADEGGVILASPDHPRTWWTGDWDQFDHYVQWNSALGKLEGHVSFGDLASSDWANPMLYESFKVTFPGVHLNAREGRLYLLDRHKRQLTIGHLEPGVYGSRVELEPNVDLSTHRHNGHLDAALVKAPE